MAVTVFHAGASQYGLLTSMMAAGSVLGALMTATRAKPGIPVLLAAAATFGLKRDDFSLNRFGIPKSVDF
jgi:hypothetical protein